MRQLLELETGYSNLRSWAFGERRHNTASSLDSKEHNVTLCPFSMKAFARTVETISTPPIPGYTPIKNKIFFIFRNRNVQK